MEYPWRPRTPAGNFCPVCSNSHFPFCPPPPPQFFRPPPPPPPDQFYHSPQPPLPPPPPTMPPPPLPPQPSYDPFVDHQGGPSVNPYAPPPPARTPPPPWNGGPSFGNDYYGVANHGLDYDNNAQIGAKRMRVNSFADDERRLKLIRDHGAPVHGFDRNYDGGLRLPNDSLEASNYGDTRGNHWDRQMNQNYGEQQIPYHELPSDQNQSNLVQNHGHTVHGADQYTKVDRPHMNHEPLSYGNATYQEQRRNFSKESWEFNNQLSQSHITQHHIMEPKSTYYGLPNRGENVCQPPLPASPSPPLPPGPQRFQFSESILPPSTSGPSSLFPVARDSSSSFQSQYTMVSEPIKSAFSQNSSISSGYYPEDIQAGKTASSKTYKGGSQEFSPSHLSLDKPTVIDASHIFKHPHRANRPDHIVVILRGLPGSGKSYFAKMLRDLEVENGGAATRIHSIDEYFMTEVEKIEENEGSKSSGSARGRKPVMKKVMEYCYEPEMEEAYRLSMLKSFKKTLDEGTFPFVIVDDRNLRVADFAQFWATAKRSGYEVYLLEATYKDPAGCAARNVHGFTQNDIRNMANQWEEAPSLYMKLDVKSLVHGDELEENGIQEVDMDTEDGNDIGDPTGSEDTNIQKVIRPAGDITSDGPSKVERERDATEEHALEVVKELGKSKWSNDLDEDDDSRTKATSGNATALSSLIKSYSKQGKSVRWADQIGRVGFSIGVGRSTNVSLFIGPGSGYNLKSNPLPDEEKLTQGSGESRRRSTFQEQLRAEHESFKAVFDKRRHRISVLDGDDD